MKAKVLILFFILTYTLIANAYTTLRVQDPQQTWKNYQGVIDTAVLSIKAKGAYFEYGLYLTFSARGHVNNYDTFEIQLFFDLPEGSMMHDSWLWINNQIIQADLIDRDKATLTYEGIVRRRRDPSILYKNSSTQYELRIFPMAANQTRKVKISYLVPAKWGSGATQCALPLNILKASAYIPYFKVLSCTDQMWQNPRITELPANYFQNVGNGLNTATISTNEISTNSELNYTLSSPMQNGIFAGKYATSLSDGYYQLALIPSQALNTNVHKKAALLFDYEPDLSSTSPAAVLANARQMLHQYFAPSDSFNLIFSQLNIYRASSVWLPCDSATIDYTFAHLNGGNPISNYSNLPSLLANGIDFLKTNGHNGELILISNSDNQGSASIANQLITDILTLMSPDEFRINVLEYTDQHWTSQYIGNTSYMGNEYFYKNLSAMTRGAYERLLISNYYYYYSYNTRSLAEASTELFETLDGVITNFDVHPVSSSGFCYAKFNSAAANIVPVNKTFIQLGRYDGTAPSQVEITGVFNSLPFSQTLDISQASEQDELTGKMWVGNYIQMLEGEYPDIEMKEEIIDNSIHGRVLSRYTAFLALEPIDTSSLCADCVDETNSTATGINDLPKDSVYLTAMPNPFNSEVKIQIHLSSTVKESSIDIYDVVGRIVKTIPVDLAGSGDLSLIWNGEDNYGSVVSAGVYFLILSVPEGRFNLKLVKQ